MITSKAASHYSKALYNMTKADTQLNDYAKALNEIARLMQETPTFSAFLMQPFVKPEAKMQMLAKLFKNKTDQKLLHFLNFLLKKKRIGLVPSIAEEYSRVVNEKLGQLEVDVTTCIPIDDHTKEAIRKTFEKTYRKKVFMHYKIDPKILGGMVCKIGNKVMDGSLKAQLAKLKEDLLAANL